MINIFELSKPEVVEPFYETIGGQIALVTGMILIMILSLVGIYFCVNKAASGYKRVGAAEPMKPSTSGHTYEMSQTTSQDA